jgi:hypothetical protein
VKRVVSFEKPTQKDYGCKLTAIIKNGEIKIIREKLYPPIKRPEADGGRG